MTTPELWHSLAAVPPPQGQLVRVRKRQITGYRVGETHAQLIEQTVCRTVPATTDLLRDGWQQWRPPLPGE